MSQIVTISGVRGPGARPPRPQIAVSGRLVRLQGDQARTALQRAIRCGLGDRVLGIDLSVHSNHAGGSYVRFRVDKREHKVHGFGDISDVHAHVSEVAGEVRARFFKSETDADRRANLLKVVVLARQNGNGHHTSRKWAQVVPPEVVYVGSTEGASPLQSSRMLGRQMRRFLTANLPEGTTLDLPARTVLPQGVIRYTRGREDVIHFCGYLDFVGQRLFGRIVVEDNQNRIYFWKTEEDRNTGKAPIRPEGHPFSIRERHGRRFEWRILWTRNLQMSERWKATERYARYLYATKKTETYEEFWPVRQSARVLERWIRGERMLLPLPSRCRTNSVFSITCEIGERFKFAEFWTSLGDRQKGHPPFATRFLTFKPNDGSWRSFGARFDDHKLFGDLIRQGSVAYAELRDTLNCPFLTDRHFHPQFDLLEYLREKCG